MPTLNDPRVLLNVNIYVFSAEEAWTIGKMEIAEANAAATPSMNNVQKVKLTGSGKMPVMDMRQQVVHRCQSLPPGANHSNRQHPQQQQQQSQLMQQQQSQLLAGHPMVQGLPPKSPVYAVVNKQTGKRRVTSPTHQLTPKNGAAQQCQGQRAGQQLIAQHQHNYCNVAPQLGEIVNKQHFQAINTNQVYACVNKTGKAQPISDQHYYENSKEARERLRHVGSADAANNYVNMDPTGSGFDKESTPLPLIPFETVDFQVIGADLEGQDPISIRLKTLHDALDKDHGGSNQNGTDDSINYPGDFNLSDLAEDLPPPPPEMLQSLELTEPLDPVESSAPNDGASAAFPNYEELDPQSFQRSQSIDAIEGQQQSQDPTTVNVKQRSNSTSTGSVTIPRSSKTGNHVTMRRSSSVPCKGPVNRGSTSSSDSGFSAGCASPTPNRIGLPRDG